MAKENSQNRESPGAAGAESFPLLLLSSNETELRALIDDPAVDESQVCLLLERKDLSAGLLEEIAKRKKWRGSYRVRRGLAAHPRTPRRTAMRLLRDLHLMDLVRISLLPGSPVELRRLAEESVISQLPKLPLGQKLMLARRGSARVAGALAAQGPEQVTRIALDNSALTESQLLKILSKDGLQSQIVGVIARHVKWSTVMNIRVALVRHPHALADRLLNFLPDLRRVDIEDLLGTSRLPMAVRKHLQQELLRREGKK